jgi:hypothetical protein
MSAEHKKAMHEACEQCIEVGERLIKACHVLMEMKSREHNTIQREECAQQCQEFIQAADLCIGTSHKYLEHNRHHVEVVHIEECIKKCHDTIAATQKCLDACLENSIHYQEICKECAHSAHACIRACRKLLQD